MINKPKSAYALVCLVLGVLASSFTYQEQSNALNNNTYTLVEKFASSTPEANELQPRENLPTVEELPAPTYTPVVSTLLSSKLYAFVRLGPDGLPARWDPCSSLTWRIDWSNTPKGFPKKSFKRNAINAMRQIRKATGLQIRMSDSTAVPSILVQFARTKDMPGEDVLGYAAVSVSRDNSKILHADIVLDATAPQRPDVSWVSWKNVLLHEMGHAVGLNHAEDESQVMFEFSNGTEKFLSGDLTALSIVGAANGCLIR
jgi:hypothetical protein